MYRKFGLILILFCIMWLATGCPEEIEDDEVELADVDAPEMLLNFAAEASDAQVLLTWDSYDEDEEDEDIEWNEDLDKDIEGILIVRGDEKYPDAFPIREDRYSVGDTLGYGTVIAVLKPNVEQFVDNQVVKGKTYFYEAFTYDEVPNYSETVKLNATPGSMVQARLSHTQTTLSDGRILLCGGIGHHGPLATAEIYNPSTGKFLPLEEELHTERFSHTGTLLDDGRVLLLGGYEEGFLGTLPTAEIFSPTTSSFAKVENEMNVGRALHTATLLPDGRVLIVGGTDGVDALASVAVFDPETETFTEIEQEMLRPRYGHQAILAGDYVYILGGFDGLESLPYAVRIDIETFAITDFHGNASLEEDMLLGRLNPTVSLLADESWLIAGGYEGTLSAGDPTAECALFFPGDVDPFNATGSFDQERSGHAAVTLADGRVLATGGVGTDMTILDSAEIYDPETETWKTTGSMRLSRTVHGQSLLPDGRVLVTGGNRSINVFEPEPASTAEIYNPATGIFTVVGAN